MSSLLHRLPQELLSEVARVAATSPSGGLPSAPARLACVDRTLNARLALFRSPPTSPYPQQDEIDPASLTHPHLWARIFRDIFSFSAVSRRCFHPSPEGYALQLVLYCKLLKWLRNSSETLLTFDDDESTPYHNQCLEIIFLMLLECDGKNTCQLEWAGAYDYCKRWIQAKLYPDLPQSDPPLDTWPREDRFASYALWNMWLLTTHDRLAAETSQEANFIKDLVFRFAFCSWRYPLSYALISRYTLPLENPQDSQEHALGALNPHSSIRSILPYPVFRSSEATPPRLNSSPSTISYFGSTLSWSPPLISNAAKLLFHCRCDSLVLRSLPGMLPANRSDLFSRRQQTINSRLSDDHVLAELYSLVQIHGVDSVSWMIQDNQLPPHVAELPGLDNAIMQLGGIVGTLGLNPSESVGLTEADILAWNAHRETPFPFRGGWNEDGDDPNNRRWPKALARDPNHPLPPAKRFEDLGLPFPCTNISAIHDTLFWRLKMCGDPFDHQKCHLFDFLHPEDVSNLALDHVLRARWNRLTPGTTWKPGLLNGLFQGSFYCPPEHWLVNSYRSNTFPVPPIGQGIADGLSPYRAHREHFIGRFQEHHLISTPFGARTTNPVVPFTCDSRTFPRNPSGSAHTPITAFAGAIDPGDELLIDEGGMNAFLPEKFRCGRATISGKPVAQFGWGPPGMPPPDRMSTYETFVPGHESTHDPMVCDGCQQRREYVDYVQAHNVGQQRKEEEERRLWREGLWREVGMSPTVPDDSLLRKPYQSPTNVQPCDGVMDILITGGTDLEHGQAWHHYHFLGRLRKWDGLVCILRIPKHIHAKLATILFYGYFESDLNFVGGWRTVTGDRLQANLATPPLYNATEGLSGSGLFGKGGAGVLGDGMRVVHEGPFTMSKVLEE